MTDRLKLAADVGGTFTDVVVERGAARWTAKVLTTPAAPEEGVLTGIDAALALAGTGLADVELFVHGTTLATNAIIERRGARTGLIATEGFRDTLEIGTESRYDQYELALARPRPLVPRPLRQTVRERVDARGAVLLPLDENSVAAAVAAFRAAEVESVAVALIHAYANGAHERRVGDLLQQALPGVRVSLSHEVCPEIREYERTSTAVANAYVQPMMDSYLQRMERRLHAAGFRGVLCLMTSGGGLTSVDLARRFPVRLVESGPAGGSVFAAQIAARLGERRVLAFDMGGTTAKISLIEDYQSETVRVFEVDRAARFLKGSGLPVRIPVIEMVEIGAGGGSLAGLDALKRVTVGPESASSVPGPACYGAGGARPAVTDAALVLGLIDPADFAGGSIALRPDLARDALHAEVGAGLDLDADMAAYAVYETVCENMASAARAHTVERGVSASQHAMVAFGGAAPLHVARVAEKIGVARVIVPPNAGVGSAIGFLAAPVSFESVRTTHMRLGAFDHAVAAGLLDDMAGEIRAWLEPAAHGAALTERRGAFMRYIGQGHEIPVALPLRPLGPDDDAVLRAQFEDAYRTLFKRVIPNAAVEIMAWSVLMSTEVALPTRVATPAPGATPAPSGEAQVFDGPTGRTVRVPRYRRSDLPHGARLPGPALIAEDETSTYVTAGFDVFIDGLGSIVMERKEHAA